MAFQTAPGVRAWPRLVRACRAAGLPWHPRPRTWCGGASHRPFSPPSPAPARLTPVSGPVSGGERAAPCHAYLNKWLLSRCCSLTWASTVLLADYGANGALFSPSSPRVNIDALSKILPPAEHAGSRIRPARPGIDPWSASGHTLSPPSRHCPQHLSSSLETTGRPKHNQDVLLGQTPAHRQIGVRHYREIALVPEARDSYSADDLRSILSHSA